MWLLVETVGVMRYGQRWIKGVRKGGRWHRVTNTFAGHAQSRRRWIYNSPLSASSISAAFSFPGKGRCSWNFRDLWVLRGLLVMIFGLVIDGGFWVVRVGRVLPHVGLWGLDLLNLVALSGKS